ncbi:MAG: transporter substrate-binding domain-containing protein [Clostridia bacterium]|nr:transporter substrate-binding domain-containing protein [Clostridia bacterium]
MKKIFAVLFALVLLAVSVSAFAEGEKDLLARIQERGKLIIATEGNWSPWTYHDENDVLTGFDIEIGALIAKGLGVEPEYMETAWDAILAGVDSGRFDIACNGVDYTEERAQKYDFSDPYVYTEIVLVVRGDNDSIQSFEDLKGKKTSNSPNSTYAERAEDLGASVTYVDTLGETLEMVLQGRVDATINAKGSVEDYLSEHPDANIKIVVTAPGDPVCYPVRKSADSASLLAAINEILSQAREDGTLAALSQKYFNADLTQPL